MSKKDIQLYGIIAESGAFFTAVYKLKNLKGLILSGARSGYSKNIFDKNIPVIDFNKSGPGAVKKYLKFLNSHYIIESESGGRFAGRPVSLTNFLNFLIKNNIHVYINK